jgi:transposase
MVQRLNDGRDSVRLRRHHHPMPAQFRVLVTRRPKYACRSCEDGVLQTPAPARLIESGLPTEAFPCSGEFEPDSRRT